MTWHYKVTSRRVGLCIRDVTILKGLQGALLCLPLPLACAPSSSVFSSPAPAIGSWRCRSLACSRPLTAVTSALSFVIGSACCCFCQPPRARVAAPRWISMVIMPCSIVVTLAPQASSFATAWCSSRWAPFFARQGYVMPLSRLTSDFNATIPRTSVVALV